MATWTKDQVELTKKLWLEGNSAFIIARRIGKTRNSVIGKLNRLGVKRDNSKLVNRITKENQDLVEVAQDKKEEQKLTTLSLTEKTCRWPVGDPATKNFWFCGKPAQPGKPYCAEHNALAFQTTPLKRERNHPAIFNNSYTNSHGN